MIAETLHTFLILVGLAGFTLAFHIYHKKNAGEPLVCPLRTKCELVTHSTYSKLFGVPIELLGMFYYAFVVIYNGSALRGTQYFTHATVLASLGFSILALLFSLYLVSIQAFVLKQWCTWCLFSGFFCLTIASTMLLAVTAGVF